MADRSIPGFHLAVDDLPRGVRLVAAGSLDRTARAALLHCGTSCLQPPDRTLIVDLAALGYCDWSGLGTLLELRAAATHAGWRFEVVNVPPHVCMIMDTTGLLTFLGAC